MIHSAPTHPDHLLPWWVNGTLTEEDYTLVQSHLAHCIQCQEEVRFLEALRDDLQHQPLPDAGELGLQRLLNEIRKPTIKRHKRYRIAAIAATFVILIQGALLVRLSSVKPVSTFEPLAQSRTETTLQIEFEPDARAADINHLLAALDARITEGPGALGVYHITVDAAKVDQALQTLRQAQGVVRHVARD